MTETKKINGLISHTAMLLLVLWNGYWTKVAVYLLIQEKFAYYKACKYRKLLPACVFLYFHYELYSVFNGEYYKYEDSRPIFKNFMM